MNPHFDISAQVEKKNFRPGPRDVVLYAKQEEGEEEEEEGAALFSFLFCSSIIFSFLLLVIFFLLILITFPQINVLFFFLTLSWSLFFILAERRAGKFAGKLSSRAQTVPETRAGNDHNRPRNAARITSV